MLPANIPELHVEMILVIMVATEFWQGLDPKSELTKAHGPPRPPRACLLGGRRGQEGEDGVS
jgi:hypothetical protein